MTKDEQDNMQMLAIRHRVREERKKRGYTLAFMKEKGANVEHIETGEIKQPRNIMRVADILQVNPAWLQFGDKYAIRYITPDPDEVGRNAAD